MRWAALLLLGLAFPPCMARAEEPMPVTSDTQGYCLQLATRMEGAGDMTVEVRRLWEQGVQMCVHGHVRGGLIRLRRAMMITRGIAE